MSIFRGIFWSLFMTSFVPHFTLAKNAYCDIIGELLVCRNMVASDHNYEYIDELLQDYLDDMSITMSSFGLFLIHSDLNYLESDLLQEYNISHLGLTDNYLGDFPPDWMLQMSKGLIYLNLHDNEVDSSSWRRFLEESPFTSSLKTLVLQRCNIDEVYSETFLDFTNLQELDLSDNVLSEIPAHAFQDNYMLEEIDLSNNLIVKLSQEAFSKLPSLKSIDLSHNLLVIIEARTFVNLENLQFINLESNWLFFIEETALNPRDQPRLKVINIQDNLFVCNCDLQWLKLWLIERDILEDSGATCVIPEELEFGQIDFCPVSNILANVTA